MAFIVPRPPFDPEVEPGLAAILNGSFRFEYGDEQVQLMREAEQPDGAALVASVQATCADYSIPGPDENEDLTLSVIRPLNLPPESDPVPGIFYIHGGGMMIGNRFSFIRYALDWVTRFRVILITVEYRLPPENPYPAPIDDCYAGLEWTAANAGELGIDPARLIVTGTSAGGGLAAGTVLLARDEGGPSVLGQLLIYPMLDDRNQTISAKQYRRGGIWDTDSNEVGWRAFLGDRAMGPDVPPYAAPARESDLSGLPATYVEVGEAEVFRDESIAFASGVSAAGGQAELHVWMGCWHGSDWLAPEARVSKAIMATRESWLKRVLGL
jgi:acetyl esterase/lipase